MQIYITKNNQQFGPFEEAKVRQMLENGQFSANDPAIRQGDKEWQRLGNLFPNSGNSAATNAAVAPVAPKKSRKGLLLGCGGFLLVGFLVAGVLGLLVYRNMNPADSTENLPNSVNNFKLDNRYPPKGNIWGTEANFVGLYSNESKTQTVIYMMTIFSNEQAAKDALRTEIARTCRAGETPMSFTFTGKNGNTISQGATCAAPLYIQKDNKLVALGGSSASVDSLITFAEHLPFNEGSTMKKKE